MQDRLYQDPELTQFYDIENGWSDDTRYCLALAVAGQSVLDLVVLTGHAFQVFLSDDDQRVVCATIAAHLKPGGQFIFDSRNPVCREWLEWTPELSRRFIVHPQLGRLEAWNDVAHDAATGIVTYETFYRADDSRQWQASARIRFASRESIAARIAEAGLKVHHWLGDWTAKPFTPVAKEIIAVGGLA